MKEEQYKLLVSQIAALIEGEKDLIAVMSNVAAAIHQTMGFWWTGFYRVVDGELVLLGILPVAARRVLKSSYRCSALTARWLPYSTLTVISWPHSTKSTACIWKRFVL